MKLTVQLIDGNYWSIEGIANESDNPIPAPGQKIVISDTWQYHDGIAYNKEDLVWDDLDRQVILYPEHLKLTVLKRKLLGEIKADLLSSGNRILLDEQTIQNIITAINAAGTTVKAREEFDKITSMKAQVIAIKYGL